MIEEEEKVNINFPTSVKSKKIIKDRLNQILRKMDLEHPLSEFVEDLEYETKGKFTFLELKEIIDNKYPKLTTQEKYFLLKYIPLTSIGVNDKTPYITLLNLFKYFEKIIEEKIISPSFILYKTAETLKNKFHTSTLEFIYSIGFNSTSIINLKEFYTKIAPKLNLDDIDCIVIFKGLDYKRCGKIKIMDFVLVLDSYRDNSVDNRYLYPHTMKEGEKNAKILKLFLDKNSISLDKLFEDGQVNYMDYGDIKSNIMKEISNNQNNFKIKDPINERTVDSVLFSVKRNFKVFRDDLENFMHTTKIDTLKDYIKLNDIQKFWIKEYIKRLDSINITPKMAFESAAQKKSPNIIFLEDLKRQLRILFPSGRISVSELNNMMDSLDINKNKIIERPKYEQIIKQINEENKTNPDENENSVNKEQNLKSFNDISLNLWNTGIKSTSYHLLPVKGNYDILVSLSKDINDNILFRKNRDEIDKNQNNMEFAEEEKVEGDQNLNYKPKSLSEGTKISDKNKKFELDGEFIDRRKLIVILENFSYHKMIFPIYDFLFYLSNNNISRQRSFEIIKYLDTDNDGYISMLQILNFVLKDLTFRSTKLLYKYLYLKVYQDLGFPSSEEFFNRYNFSIYDIINVNNLAKFYIALNIEMPLIMRSYDELRNTFKPPLIYKNICELIDYYKNDSIMNNFSPSEKEEEQYSISINNFDLKMKNFVYGLLDKKDSTKDDYARASRIHQKLKPILKNCVNKMNLSQYNLFFSKPLNIEPNLAMGIFQLLKTIMPNGEQILDKDDLIMFLESYSLNSDICNIKYNRNKTIEEQKIQIIEKIIETIELNASPIKYAFECIPFRKSGLITSSELMKYLELFYGESISKNDLMFIIKYLDSNKAGFINYNQIQMFLYNFSKNNKFSINIELKLITCNLYKKKYSSANEYFMNDDFKGVVKNYQKITKKQHAAFFKELCSSNKNRKELYYYLTKLSRSPTYDIRHVADIIDGYLELDYFTKEKKRKKLKKIEPKEEDYEDKMPEQKVFEKALQNINLGDDGKVFMNQLLMQLPSDCQKAVSFKFDINRVGYIPYSDFINICREIYGTEINLNYKLCAQYIYKKFIKSPELIQSYLLKRIGAEDILTYISYDTLYSQFMYAFVNDKFLLEDFFNIYKERKGKHENMLKMHSFQQFIFYNNPELKAFPKIDFVKPNKEEISSQDNNIIDDLIKKKLISIREIIDMIQVEEADLKKDFTINEQYMKNILSKYFDYTEEEINIFCNYFRYEENKFNIKKFFLYDKGIKDSMYIIFGEEILPKIKEQIFACNISSYRHYKLKYFKGDYLTINEVYSKFYDLYHLTLFHCLLIIGDEQFLSIEKFYSEYELKDLFPEKEYEPILKTAILRLNNYFEEHPDKLKLFKEIDLDKNGILSKEEFMTLLNSMDELNLEDSQKLKLLTVADKNKDGKINSKEFLYFIKSAKYLSSTASINELKSDFPKINKNIAINNTKFIPRFLNDITIVQKSLEINKKIATEDNGFLNAIIILQEDIVNNFFKFDCIEIDFNKADYKKTGKVEYYKFQSILKKRLFSLENKNFQIMIDLANEGLDDNIKAELKSENLIDYKNFLKNLIYYREEGKEPKKWENEKKPKKIEEEEKEKKSEKGIQLGGTAITETKIEKDEENELDKFNQNDKKDIAENIDEEEEKKSEKGIQLGGTAITEAKIEKDEENELDKFNQNDKKDIIDELGQEDNNIKKDDKDNASEDTQELIENNGKDEKQNEDISKNDINDSKITKEEVKEINKDEFGQNNIEEVQDNNKDELNQSNIEEMKENDKDEIDYNNIEGMKENNNDKQENEDDKSNNEINNDIVEGKTDSPKKYGESIPLGNTLLEETNINKDDDQI